MSRGPLLAAVLVMAAGCASGGPTSPLARPSGPPEIDLQAVREHARQFDQEVPQRPAGSQQEEIAATYLLAHMQVAGYLVRLDAVPVGDLVRSTNVVAPPPSGEDPRTMVVVSYDTAPAGGGDSEAIGLWLELARALGVREPDHAVSFVALGAEHAGSPGTGLGSRRLARFLLDEGQEPLIVEIGRTSGRVSAVGPGASEILPGASETPPADGDVLIEAGFDHMRVTGEVSELGPLLLDLLAERSH